jgi:hypothetical protein
MGLVRDSGTSQGISDATLQVTSGPDASASAVADSNGQYVFPALQAGMFTVQAQASGYVASSQTVTLLAPGKSDFQLAAVAQPSGSSAVGVKALFRSGAVLIEGLPHRVEPSGGKSCPAARLPAS